MASDPSWGGTFSGGDVLLAEAAKQVDCGRVQAISN